MNIRTEKKIIEYGLPLLLVLFLIAAVLADAYFFPGGGVSEKASASETAAEPDTGESEGPAFTEGLFTDEAGGHYRMADGSLYTGWMETPSGNWFFDENGCLVEEGLRQIGEELYFFERFLPLTGWQEREGRLWFFDESGRSLSGFLERDGKTVFLDEQGKLAAGEREIGGVMYLFGSDGSLKNGWEGESWFRNGYRAVGYTVVEGVGRFFREDGTMAKNCRKGRYDIDENGVATDRFPEIIRDNLAEYTAYIFEEYGDKLWSIYCFVRYNFSYVYREDAPAEEKILRMLNTGLGSCYDYAALMNYLYTEAGYECTEVRGAGTFHDEHAWVMVLLPNGVWRHVDPIWQEAEVYCMTDDELRALDADPGNNCTYKWNPENYPKVEPSPDIPPETSPETEREAEP